MPQSTYRITTDQGTYNVTVEDPATPADKNQSHIAATPQSESGDVVVDNLKNLGMGALKSAARVGQMIPGVAAGTDKLFRLPAGASRASTQAANGGEQVGGYIADAALAAAGGAADIAAAPVVQGMKVVPKTVAQVVSKGAATTTGAAIDALAGVSRGAVAAAKASFTAGGPITHEKIGGLVVKYGEKAVKLALGILGAETLYDAWKALHK